MKNRLCLLAFTYLLFTTAAVAQFSDSYLTGFSRNNSGYIIEHYDDGLGNPGYIMATTSYTTGAVGSATNGIRVIVTDNAGAFIFDRRFTNLPDVHVLDICRDAATNTYLFTGYMRTSTGYRPYILRISATGGFIAARTYNPVGSLSTWHFQALSIVTYGSGTVAITGFGSPLVPTASNASGQMGQQMFVTRVNIATLAPLGTTFFNRPVSFANPYDVPICMTDVPGVGLHITGSTLSTLPGRREAVLNVMFDYAGNLLWDQSFMDLATQDVEIGEFTYYDSYYGLLYIASYKYNSRSIGIYMVDPFSGTVMAGMEYSDPNMMIYDILGLNITKDDINTPDELYISGYIIRSSGYPFSSTTQLPVFTTTMNITDLFSANANTVNLYIYDIPNDQYNWFNFTNHMLASPMGSTVVSIPSHLGFSPQMAIMDGSDIVISSNRISMVGGWHPTMSKHLGYFNSLCPPYVQTYKYSPCTVGYTPPVSWSPQTLNPMAVPVPITVVTPSITSCGSPFFLVPNDTEQVIDTQEPDADEMMSTDEEQLAGARFYPTIVNGASATLYFEFTDDSNHDLQIAVYDMSGRLIESMNRSSFPGSNRIEINANHLSTGMNLIKIGGLEKPVVYKVIRN